MNYRVFSLFFFYYMPNVTSFDCGVQQPLEVVATNLERFDSQLHKTVNIYIHMFAVVRWVGWLYSTKIQQQKHYVKNKILQILSQFASSYFRLSAK